MINFTMESLHHTNTLFFYNSMALRDVYLLFLDSRSGIHASAIL